VTFLVTSSILALAEGGESGAESRRSFPPGKDRPSGLAEATGDPAPKDVLSRNREALLVSRDDGND
jgi:hypothetical protein